MSLKYLDIGPRYSQGIIHGNLLYIAGQVDDTSSDVASQTEAVLAKIASLLQRGGSDKSHIISATIWLSDVSTFAEMNSVWESWIDPTAPPTRATVESRLAAPQYKVEIAVISAVIAL